MTDPTIIHFINHAGYIQQVGDTRLLVDPWLSGDAFHHGWSLLAPTVSSPEVINSATRIWVSHEHPDHFSPTFFRSVDKKQRSGKTFFYQKTNDRKVVKAVSEWGYPTTELADRQWARAGRSLELALEAVPIGDSLLVTRSKGMTIANLNDCAHTSRAFLDALKKFAGDVDVLLTQFGYASWHGAPHETDRRRRFARAQLERVTKQVRALRPKFVIPFASFSYFSAEENRFMNDANNNVLTAYDHLLSLGVKPIVLYPGNEWEVGTTNDNVAALEHWKIRYQLPEERHKGKPVPFEGLKELAGQYTDRMLEYHSAALVRAAHMFRLGFFGPIDIYLNDHGETVRFSISEGLEASCVPRGKADIAMHSESLAFLLEFDYGLNTLLVNGRFSATSEGCQRLVRAFGLGSLRNNGQRFSLELVTNFPLLWRSVFRAFAMARS